MENASHSQDPSDMTSVTTYTALYTFASKERDEESGLSYFGARYYSSDLSIWLSVDPMSDKYPYQSNYVYCSNNPLKVIDPNGEDEWDIDEKGNLKKTKDNKDIDILHSTKTRQSMEFPVGTINEMSKDMGTVNYDGKNITVDFQYLDINDDDLASCFFEFVAENTEIEWSLIQTGTKGNQISRDSQYRDPKTGDELDLDLANASGTCLLKRFLDNNVSIRASKHSHPFVEGRNIVPEPSGYDMGAKIWFLDKYKELANFKYEAYGKKDGCWQYMPY